MAEEIRILSVMDDGMVEIQVRKYKYRYSVPPGHVKSINKLSIYSGKCLNYVKKVGLLRTREGPKKGQFKDYNNAGPTMIKGAA